MKICIPTETNAGLKASVYGHFGSAPYFTIFDTNNNSVDIIDNSNQDHAHGTCNPMNALLDKDIKAVVCGGMGSRAIEKLNESGIKAFRSTSAGNVEDIVKQFNEKKLDEMTVENACMHHNCH